MFLTVLLLFAHFKYSITAKRELSNAIGGLCSEYYKGYRI